MPWDNPWKKNDSSPSLLSNLFGRSPIQPNERGGSTIYGKDYSYPSWVISDAGKTILPYVFYISLFIFILFLILVFIHFTVYPIFSFSPNDNGFIPIPTASDRQIAFTKSPAAADLSANFINVPVSSYTIGMDLYFTGVFEPSNTPLVLLYRSNDIQTPPTDSKSLITTYSKTNLIVWLDSFKNDLKVSGIQKDSNLQTSVIENVPIKKVFRVTFVFADTFLEVYINGKLESTQPFQNLKPVADTYRFYTGRTTSSVQMSNLTFWPRILSAREVQAWGSPMSKESFYISK
jgi:hypothetical protein